MLKLINFVIINKDFRQACYALVSVELLSSLICYVFVLLLYLCSIVLLNDIFLLMICFKAKSYASLYSNQSFITTKGDCDHRTSKNQLQHTMAQPENFGARVVARMQNFYTASILLAILKSSYKILKKIVTFDL